MINYFCEECKINIETSICPNCGTRTEMTNSTIFWCDNCNVPIFDEICACCSSKGRRIGSDIRPVFPEERLLLELLLEIEPMTYKHSSVWNTSGNHYIVDGKRIIFSVQEACKKNPEEIKKRLVEFKELNHYTSFESYIEKFIEANKNRYNFITSEATDFIRKTSEGFRPTEMYVSFSGGKDSTATSSLVMRALGTEEILHIYGDTTLEFPKTKKYIQDFKSEHRRTPLITAKNKDKDFYQLCEQLGPPSRVMRWCCTIFKTGAIQRKINSLFKNNKKVLTFYGIRRSESKSRNKYDRESDSPKIAIQKTVSPIIDWLDFDIWLYLFSSNTSFNEAYKLGYSRVGCWCCPNNSSWSSFLSSIYMSEEYTKFNEFLIDFAKKIGKPDPEVYVGEGKWKARQGGNGLSYAETSILTFEPCALMEDTINFELQKTISEDFYELFKPFGFVNKTIGNSRLGEVYITDKEGKLLLKLTGKIGKNTLKVSILDKEMGKSRSLKAVEDLIKCQITKYQMCMGCLACEANCIQGAISIVTNQTGIVSYKIDDAKCIRCRKCINHFSAGCYMRKVMAIKRV